MKFFFANHVGGVVGHVAVDDADYQFHRDILTDTVAKMARSGAAYVQFPQAYPDVGAGAHDFERERNDNLICFAGHAGQVGAMMLTGSLSVLEVGGLRAVGGWSRETITEDAELGLRLQAAGRRGIWLPAERGDGILPLDFDSLRKQRARWLASNIECLRKRLLDGSLWASSVDTLRWSRN